MPNSSFDFSLIENKWKEFSTLIFQEIKRLKNEKINNNVEIRKNSSLIKIIRESQSNIEFMIKYEKSFVELDEQLTTTFAALKQFSFMEDGLKNEVASMLQQQVLSSPNITRVFELADKFDDIDIELNNKILKLEELRSGKVYDDDLIMSLSASFGLDKSTSRMIRIYPLLKSGVKNKVQNNNKVVENSIVPDNKTPELIEKPIIENEELQNQIEDVVELDKMESLDVISDTIDYVNTSNYKNEFDIQKAKYEQAKEKYNGLINDYYKIVSQMNQYEKEAYKYYALISEKELKEINEFDYNNDLEAQSKIITYKILDAKSDIEKLINNIIHNNFENIDDIEYIELLIEEFNKCAEKLSQIDSQLKHNKIINPNNNPSNVYFLMDYEGNIIMPDDTIQFLPVYAKMAEYSEVDNIVKKDPFIIKDIEADLGRIVIAQRVNNSAISFVRVRTGEGSTGEGILIIAAAPVTNGGYTGIQKETKRIAKKYESMIREQINMIETRNLQYITSQSEIKESLIQSGRKMGGESGE